MAQAYALPPIHVEPQVLTQLQSEADRLKTTISEVAKRFVLQGYRQVQRERQLRQRAAFKRFEGALHLDPDASRTIDKVLCGSANA